MHKNQIMRPVPEIIRAGRTLSPDQRLITGTLDHVLSEVRRGRRVGAFQCDHVSERDGQAWAVVTLAPARSNVLPVALIASAVGLALFVAVWLLVSAAGAAVLIVLCAAGTVAILRSGTRAPGVRVGVNVEVNR